MNGINPPTLDSASAVRPASRAWRIFCLFYYGLAVFYGARYALVTTSTALFDLVFPTVMYICLCSWALTDARERRQPIARSLQFWYYLFAPIVVPGYLLGTRGWKGLAWIAFHVVAWAVVATAAMQGIGLIYWGDAWWRHLQIQ
jgi:hypothetical protein